MREQDVRIGRTNESVRPRWMVFENVPGLLSSNNGEDFRTVLEETARIVDQTATIPRPSNGKWSNSGTILGDGFSISWKIHDGQFWGKSIISPSGEVVKRGTPQRRRRISLVADFGGRRAGEVLFEPKGLYRNNEPSQAQREETSRSVRASVNRSEPPTVIYEMQHSCDVIRQNVDVSPTLQNRMGPGGNNVPLTLQCVPIEGNGYRNSHRGDGYGDVGDPSFTLNSVERHGVAVGAFAAGFKGGNGSKAGGIGDVYNDMLVVIASSASNAEISTNGVCTSLLARAGTGGNNTPIITTVSAVRRLTPKECERLQGFPDDWTSIGEWIDSKGKKHKEADSPRYKALGNSICLPFWEWLAKKICAEYDRPITMASLFDGIGGFPLAFERAGAKAVWASEIEEFPMAVTKVRFPEDGKAEKQ